MVRLEPHDKQTHFELGDPVTLGLVFTAKSPGYAVFMDTNRSNASEDLVNVTPADGRFRSQGNQYGGPPEDLGLGLVRMKRASRSKRSRVERLLSGSLIFRETMPSAPRSAGYSRIMKKAETTLVS
jgi:hypothetical protein